MRVSTKGLYAVRLMLNLTLNGNETPMSLKDIADLTGISKKYLEQIVPSLVAAKLVRAQRGAAGGYRLAKPADSITLLDILTITETTLAPTSCLECDDGFECDKPQPCMELEVWRGLKQTMDAYLGGITLQKIVDDNVAAPGLEVERRD